jgi:hypothetical protein
VERLRRIVQLRAVGLGLAALATESPTYAQGGAPQETASPAEIVAARELFRLGTEDADAGRFTDGLEKFKRVAAVKETAAVRFNIARCEEALGRTGGALADFELAAREGRDDPKAQDVARLAGERANALRPQVPRLTVVGPSPIPDGLTVSVDGGKLASATLGVGLPLDPGSHVVEATAPGRGAFHTQLTLAAGEARSVALVLPAAEIVPAAKATSESPAAARERPASTSSQPAWGWVSIAGGGALAAGAGVFLVLHNNAVGEITGACQATSAGVVCPSSQQSQIESSRSNAQTDQAVAIGLAAASGAAIVLGVVLLATAPTTVSVTTGAAGAPAGLTLRGSF